MDGIRRRQTIAILVDNEAGVLSQVSRMFSRKGYNIESIASGVTSDPNITRITIELTADDGQAEFLCNQLRKIIQVHSVKLLTDSQALRRELVLFKVATKDSAERNEIIQVANIFRASVIDVAVESLTIAVIGDEEKVGGIQSLLGNHEIKELVRTGIVAMERGGDTIYDNTKVKGEFDYGKNVL
ncbi:MAG: acetolactate synthase small subunit [Clostridia bacterium]|nr:acetolactate synthase small subunit [Clostridia bacterium]